MSTQNAKVEIHRKAAEGFVAASLDAISDQIMMVMKDLSDAAKQSGLDYHGGFGVIMCTGISDTASPTFDPAYTVMSDDASGLVTLRGALGAALAHLDSVCKHDAEADDRDVAAEMKAFIQSTPLSNGSLLKLARDLNMMAQALEIAVRNVGQGRGDDACDDACDDCGHKH